MSSFLPSSITGFVGNNPEVALVGAGPGDPGLLTLKALKLIQQADFVLYDALVSQPILDFIPEGTPRLYVGKRSKKHSLPQGDLNQLLADKALEVGKVVRLKGGDPFVFGRGGEEVEHLASLGVAFQVVPGITAAIGCGAYAGIPLTHRDYAQSLRVATGHRRPGEELDFSSLVEPNQTLVFYMGLAQIDALCDGLVKHGLNPNTPAALVEKGTRPDQKVWRGTVSTLRQIASEGGAQPPTLIIIGETVGLSDQLDWFTQT